MTQTKCILIIVVVDLQYNLIQTNLRVCHEQDACLLFVAPFERLRPHHRDPLPGHRIPPMEFPRIHTANCDWLKARVEGMRGAEPKRQHLSACRQQAFPIEPASANKNPGMKTASCRLSAIDCRLHAAVSLLSSPASRKWEYSPMRLTNIQEFSAQKFGH